jgi:hypothetical protein
MKHWPIIPNYPKGNDYGLLITGIMTIEEIKTFLRLLRDLKEKPQEYEPVFREHDCEEGGLLE